MSREDWKLPRTLRDRELAGLTWQPEGDIASPDGFRAAGVHCGIKNKRLDLALVVSDPLANAAGLFTTNRVPAPPVVYCRQRLEESQTAKALVVNSGNANACTGERGWKDTLEMALLVSKAVGCAPEQVLVASTGVIGRTMPMEALRSGVPLAAAALGADGQGAAEAIMTTDTKKKNAAVRVQLSGGAVTIGGMAKGSGMIAPDMQPAPHATTLVFLTSDAVVGAEDLQELLGAAMAGSFNSITVDGDTSTNDTAICLANGASSVGLDSAEDREIFARSLMALATKLALDVVADGEGASRVIEVRVTGAADDGEAKKVARTVAESPLVKTAFCAGEPNWGRLMMAIGRSGCTIDPERIGISVGDLEIVRTGLGTDHLADDLIREMTRDEVTVAIELGLGRGQSTMWTCDLSEEYVRINARYLT